MDKFTFKSNDKSNDISAYVWKKSNVNRAIIQLVHGMAEYALRYDEFADKMSANGYIVCAHDHLGHGGTAKPEDRGFFAEEDGYTYVLQDVLSMTRIVKKQYDLPVILMGHSMGSLVTRCLVAEFPDEYDGFIICGTAGSVKLPGMSKLIIKREISKRGAKTPNEFLDKVQFGKYNKHVQNPSSPNSWLTRDVEEVKKYDESPLCGFTFTSSAFMDLLQLAKSCNSPEWAGSMKKALPLLIISGSEDPVGEYGKGVLKVYHRLMKAGIDDLTLKLYEGARHELLNETNRDEVFTDILNWCNHLLV